MREENSKYYSFLSIQAFSFVLLVLFSLSIGSSFAPLLALIIIEIVLLLKSKKNLLSLAFYWQLEVFIVILFGLAIYPNQLLNSSEVPGTVQISFIIAAMVVEAIIWLVFIYKEKVLLKVLKGSTISLLAIVVLIIVLVGNEGVSGFLENDPVKMLTTTDFNPLFIAGSTSSTTYYTSLDPYDFNISASDSNIHTTPQKSRNVSITLSNNGALDDSYTLSWQNSRSISFSMEATHIDVHSGEAKSLNATLFSTDYGDYSITVDALDDSNLSKTCNINVYVSDHGFDFTRENGFLYAQGLESSYGSESIGILNTGTKNETCILSIDAPSYFVPYLDIPEWNYTSRTASLSLTPGELTNLTLIPRLITARDGNYTVRLNAYDGDGMTLADTFSLLVDVSVNRLIVPERQGNIPLALNTTTSWNVTYFGTGSSTVYFSIPKIPEGMTIQAFVNQTEELSTNGGSVYINSGGVANIELQLHSNVGFGNGTSSFDVQVTSDKIPLQPGILGFIAGSVLITFISLVMAVPVALGSAIFLAKYSSNRVKRVIKPIMEVLVGIPSVVYGLWGALTFGPMLASTVYPVIDSTIGSIIPFFSGPYQTGRSIMTASIVLSIMIFPIIMSLSYEAISSVPEELEEGSLSLGASKWQTIRKVILVRAKSGIFSSIVLAMGRALGETMAVLMIMNYQIGVPTSIFSGGSTMTSAIAASFNGVFAIDQSRHVLFSIALLLFLFVLLINLLLILITKEEFWQRFSVLKKIPNEIKKAIGPSKRNKDSHSGEHVPQVRDSFVGTGTIRKKEVIMKSLIFLSAVITLAIIGYIIGDIIIRGGLSFKLDYLTADQIHGGFLNAALGSLMLVALAIGVALPITLLSAIYVNEYTQPSSMICKITYLSVSALSSTPSIIFGAFGFMLFVLYLGFGFSMLAGGLTLAFMVLPLLYISNIEALKTVPHSHREASYALGVSKWTTIKELVIPISLPSISSGVILGIGRAIGETAAILLTAGFAMFITTSVVEQVGSLPNMIYNFYDSSAGNPVLMEKLYAAAFLLIVIVVVLNITSKIIGYHYSVSRIKK